MLRAVKLNRQDTCLTYTMKRLGFEHLLSLGLNSVVDLYKFFDFSVYDEQELHRGTLVCWNLFQEEIRIPNEILENGSILENTLLINFHLGIIEDKEKKLVSDSTRKLQIGIPIIRIRNLDSIRLPDLILHLRKEYLPNQTKE